MYRWHVDFCNVAQLRSARNHVHVLFLCLFGARNAEDSHSLEKIYDTVAIGT